MGCSSTREIYAGEAHYRRSDIDSKRKKKINADRYSHVYSDVYSPLNTSSARKRNSSDFIAPRRYAAASYPPTSLILSVFLSLSLSLSLAAYKTNIT